MPATFAAMAKIVVDAVRPHETAVATGMNTVMRTVGGVIGGQLLAVILTANTIGRHRLPSESAYTTMFWLCAVRRRAGGGAAGLFLAPAGGGRRRRARSRRGGSAERAASRDEPGRRPLARSSHVLYARSGGRRRLGRRSLA